MTCDHPPITISDPVRELQTFYGTRPVCVESILYRQFVARDRSLEPQLYNSLASGPTPGLLSQTFPLPGVADDSSDDRQSAMG